MRELFDDNGVFDKVVAALCLALSLVLCHLGLDRHHQGGSIGWAVLGFALVLASACETVRRFRPRR